MDVETITKLLDAGYTKADIDKMSVGDAKGSDESAGAENESAEKKGEESANEVKSDNVADMLKTLTDTVNGLTATVKAMQDSNAKGAHTDSPKATDAIKAAMDSFIETL